MGKDKYVSIEFNEDEEAKWEKNMDRKQKENELIDKLASLTKKEMRANRSLTIDEAIIKVINKTPEIKRMIKDMEDQVIDGAVRKMDVGDMLNHYINKKMQSNNISFREALQEVQIENPELAKAYVSNIRNL